MQDIDSQPEMLQYKEILPVEERYHLTQIQDNKRQHCTKSQENCSKSQKSPLLPTPKKQDPPLEISTETFQIHNEKLLNSNKFFKANKQ